MKNIAIVASQDRGKSFLIKNELLPNFQNNRDNYIFDINNEYEFKNQLWVKFKELPEINEFLEAVPHHTDSYCNVVFEEATGFFSKSGSLNKIALQHVTRRFHTKNLNIFVFHSLLGIPEQIRMHMDFIHLFRTDDNIDDVDKEFKKYPKVVEVFKDVKDKTENTYFNRHTKTYPDEYSKNWFHYKRIINK